MSVKKNSSGEEDRLKNQIRKYKILGWIAVSAAGSHTRNVLFTDTGRRGSGEGKGVRYPQNAVSVHSIKRGEVLLTEILLPRIARQETVCLNSIRG